MRLHRFIGDFDFNNKTLRIHGEELINQIQNVLRLKPGKEIVLADGKLNEALVQIKDVGRRYIEVEIQNIYKNENEPERNVILYCSILKRENFELVVQKATEVGVKKIVPIIAERTVKLNLREDRLQKIIKEAAEQSGRGIIPELEKTLTFGEALESAKENDQNVFLDLSGEIKQSYDIASRKIIGIWVGPEGGWSETELNVALRQAQGKQKNFKVVSLGKLTLRAETAAVIASYLAVH